MNKLLLVQFVNAHMYKKKALCK